MFEAKLQPDPVMHCTGYFSSDTSTIGRLACCTVCCAVKTQPHFGTFTRPMNPTARPHNRHALLPVEWLMYAGSPMDHPLALQHSSQLGSSSNRHACRSRHGCNRNTTTSRQQHTRNCSTSRPTDGTSRSNIWPCFTTCSCSSGTAGGAGRWSQPARTPLMLLLFVLMLLAGPQQPLCAAAASDKPLQIAIVNQVHFHLEVVAGAMHILKQMTSAPVTIYLPAKVLKTNWYGFINWLGGREGFIWKEGKEYDGKTQYDLVWFITPERHLPWITTVSEQMKPKVALYMVHNGNLPDTDFKVLNKLAGNMPLLTLAPHVAKNISKRVTNPPEWVLPVYPYTPAAECRLSDLQVGGG